jgi:twitching motility two-component system response regulator PilH
VKSILLVEDSKLLRHANQRALMRAGYSVLAACDGEEALRMAREEFPDLILLDMLLPKLSGPDVLSALRGNPRTAEVPIIVLSGLSQRNESKLLQDGANAYFEKSKLDSDEGWQLLLGLVQETLGTAPQAESSKP